MFYYFHYFFSLYFGFCLTASIYPQQFLSTGSKTALNIAKINQINVNAREKKSAKSMENKAASNPRAFDTHPGNTMCWLLFLFAKRIWIRTKKEETKMKVFCCSCVYIGKYWFTCYQRQLPHVETVFVFATASQREIESRELNMYSNSNSNT